jgi:DNA-binding transcriptional ArsR family regulator
MEANSLIRSRLEISHPTAAEWLLSWKKRRLLEPFVHRPMTIGEAAESIQVTPNTLYYHVNEFKRYGLLEEAGSVNPEGNAAKVYQATAEKFLVLFTNLSSKTIDKVIKRVTVYEEPAIYTSNLLAAQRRFWGILISVGNLDNGIPFTLELVPASLHSAYKRRSWMAPETSTTMISAVHLSQMLIKLDDERAKEFQQELTALVERFKQQQSVSGKPYHVALAMTPTVGR